MSDVDVATAEPSDPGPTAPSAALRWLVAAVVGILVAVGAAALATAVAGDDVAQGPGGDQLVLPEPPVEVMSPLDPEADADQGAAVVGLDATGSGDEGLEGGTWITDVASAQGIEAPTTGEAASLDAEPVWGPGPAPDDQLGSTAAVPADAGASSPSGAPSAEVDLGANATGAGGQDLADGTWQLDGFVDACAEGASPCPAGEPGTVITFGGSAGNDDGLHVKAWPGLNGLVSKNLQCEPGYRTSTRLPVVVTTDDPVSWLKVTLSIDGGAKLDEVYKNVSDSKAQADWEKTIAAGGTTSTDLGSSFHHCYSLRTEQDPINAALANTVLPADARYRIDVAALAMVGPNQAVASATYAMAFTPDRPPTTIWPMSTHRAQVVVPQIGSAAGTTRVWAERSASYADGKCSTFGAGPNGPQGFEGGWPSATPRKLWTPSEPYPYDRAYDHFTVWNLVLQDTFHYVVCVQWRGIDGNWGPTETWAVVTPAALRLDVFVKDFAKTGNATQDDYILRAENVPRCNRWVVSTESADNSSGTGLEACTSDGWPVPSTTKIELEGRDADTGTYVDLGQRSFFTPTVCPADALPSWVENITFLWYLLPCSPKTFDVTFKWATGQNVLCGGPIASCAGEGVEATSNGQLRFTWAFYGTWPTSPSAWDISLVGATYGTGLTGGGQSLP